MGMRKPKTKYHTKVECDIIMITDLNEGMSVTNNIETVLSEIEIELGHPIGEFKVIYKDTMGRIDGVITKDNKFSDFYSIGEDDFEYAKPKVKENE